MTKNIIPPNLAALFKSIFLILFKRHANLIVSVKFNISKWINSCRSLL